MLPGDPLPGGGGSGVRVGRHGRNRRRSYSSSDWMKSTLHHQGGSRDRLESSNKRCLSDSVEFSPKTGCLPSFPLDFKEFKTKEPQVTAIRLISCASTRQFLLLYLIFVQCSCSWFYGNCVSNFLPELSFATDKPDPQTLSRDSTYGDSSVAAVDITGEHTATDIVQQQGSVAETISRRESGGLSSPEREQSPAPQAPASAGREPSDASVGGIASQEVNTSPGKSDFFQVSTNAETTGNVTSSSLLSTEEGQTITTSKPLPAGYQTYKEMLTVLQNLSSTTCPELTLTERRHGKIKIDVLTLKRTTTTTTENERLEDVSQSPERQRIFILSGEHPRELVPPAVLLRFVQLVCNAQSPAVSGNEQLGNTSAEDAFPSVAAAADGGDGERDEEGEREQKSGNNGQAQASQRDSSSGGAGNSSSGNDEQRQIEDEGREKDPRRFSKLLENAEFQIILNANPLGRDQVEEGDFCKRGTMTNVDLNRNWGAFWEPDTTEGFESPAAGEQADVAVGDRAAGAVGEYLTGGPSPFSEPETQLLRDILLQFQPTLFISLHSGQLGVYTPFGHTERRPAAHSHRSEVVAEKVAKNPHCKNTDSPTRCVTGIAGKYFAAKGNCMDWVVTSITPPPLAFLLEIYKAERAVPRWPTQAKELFTQRSEDEKQNAQVEKENENDDTTPVTLPDAAELERDTPLGEQLEFSFIHTGVDRVGTSENTSSTQRKTSMIQKRYQTRRLAHIHPHFSSATILHQSNSGRSGRAAGLTSGEESSASVYSDFPSTSKNSGTSGNKNKREGWNARRMSLSLLETKHNSTSKGFIAGEPVQSSQTPDAQEKCFRTFNPHDSTAREEALDGWSEVLLQLIQEVQSTAVLE